MTNSYLTLDYRTRGAFSRALAAVLLPALMLPAVSAAHAQGSRKELHIAAAADLQPVLPTLAEAYERQTGVHLIPSFGSSATLAQQLQNGDPQDVFLSADFVHPEQLIAADLAYGIKDAKNPTQYARGVLVLWARKDSPAQPLTLNVLSSPKITRIAVANDLHAPYGLAATRALAALNLTAQVKDKLVVAENIGQTAQFAESGNAQVGIISLTIASSPHFRELGSFVRFPMVYPPILQCGVVLKSSAHPQEAREFLSWLTSPEVQKRLPAFGLDPAEP